MFNVFQTFSFGDMHWPGLHTLFPESKAYLDKIVVDNADQIPAGQEDMYITKRDDFLLRASAVNKHAGLCVDYFCQRVESFLEQVATPVLGLSDSAVRYEFQDRGAIHAHCLLRFEKGVGPAGMKAALQDYRNILDSKLDLDERMKKMEEILARKDPVDVQKATEKANAPNNDSKEDDYMADLDEITKLQENIELTEKALKARRYFEEFVARDIGISALHPRMEPHTWKVPYGDVTTKPLINPMRLTLSEIMESNQSIQDNYERLVDICQLHNCLFRYCLKEIGMKKDEKEKLTSPEAMAKEQLVKDTNEKGDEAYFKCRFGYPMELFGYDATYMSTTDPGCQKITAVNKCKDKMLRGAHVEPSKDNPKVHTLYYPRNHPSVNFHVKEFLEIWRANTDTKPIFDVDQVRRYLFDYVCKHEKETSAFKKATKAVAALAPDTTSPKTLLQQMIIKGVSKDISLQECHLHLNKKRHHGKLSMTTHNLSVAGGKALNLETDDLESKVTKASGYQDIYWNREKDPNYAEICNQYDAFKNEGTVDEFFKKFSPNWENPPNPRDCCLHDFVAFFDKQWRPKKNELVPIISPFFQKVPNINKTEQFEKFARTRLLEFKPGATPDNVAEGFESITDAFEDFLKTNQSPRLNFLREMYSAAISRKPDTEEGGQVHGEGDYEDNDDIANPPNDFEDLVVQPNGNNFNF